MASTPLGDIAGARFIEQTETFAAVASGGANARLVGPLGPFPHNIRARALYYVPTTADQAATQTASYRRLSLYNGGTAGTATSTASRMASHNLIASQASLGALAWGTVDTTVTAASGSVLYFSQETVGAAEANGTVLAGGKFSLHYEII